MTKLLNIKSSNMKKEELIKKIQEEIPDGAEVCIFDWRANLHHGGGESSSAGIYSKIEVSCIKPEEQDLEDFEPWGGLSFESIDYDEEGQSYHLGEDSKAKLDKTPQELEKIFDRYRCDRRVYVNEELINDGFEFDNYEAVPVRGIQGIIASSASYPLGYRDLSLDQHIEIMWDVRDALSIRSGIMVPGVMSSDEFSYVSEFGSFERQEDIMIAVPAGHGVLKVVNLHKGDG